MAEVISEENIATENPDISTSDTEKQVNDGRNKTQVENQSNNEQLKIEDTVADLSREELIDLYRNSNIYIGNLESKLSAYEAEILSLKNSADYQKQRDPSYREKILLRKLSLKDQEIHDYVAQISELKASQIPSLTTLKSTLLDPAVNIIVQKLKNELSSTKASLEETQNELNAWKFTPDSNTGKRLMAKCRLLHQENEELGKMISSGRVAKLEGELALQKSFSEEVKKSQFELDELLQDLDEDVEGMQGTIYYLQQELKKSKEKIVALEAKNQELCDLIDNNRTQSNETNGNTKKSQEDTDNVNNKSSTFNEDESSNDSSYLILEVNPEGEEYATMLNADDETGKSNENEELDFKNKRSLDDNSKTIPPKKQRRVNQEFVETKESGRE